MKRLLKLAISLVITYILIRLFLEYLRPTRVRLDEYLSSMPPPAEPPPPSTAPRVSREPAATGSSRVSLNQADVSALTALPGVGPALAQRIVNRREQVGPFARLDELQQIRGIGSALVERLRPLVTLN